MTDAQVRNARSQALRAVRRVQRQVDTRIERMERKLDRSIENKERITFQAIIGVINDFTELFKAIKALERAITAAIIIFRSVS